MIFSHSKIDNLSHKAVVYGHKMWQSILDLMYNSSIENVAMPVCHVPEVMYE